MDKNVAVRNLLSLASGVRLDIYRLLVKKGPEGLVAGDIGAALKIAPTNLSFHLKDLTQAGLLSVEQEGRYQRYRANMKMMNDLVLYLTEECCGGNPDACGDLRVPLAKARKRTATRKVSA